MNGSGGTPLFSPPPAPRRRRTKRGGGGDGERNKQTSPRDTGAAAAPQEEARGEAHNIAAGSEERIWGVGVGIGGVTRPRAACAQWRAGSRKAVGQQGERGEGGGTGGEGLLRQPDCRVVYTCGVGREGGEKEERRGRRPERHRYNEAKEKRGGRRIATMRLWWGVLCAGAD